MENKKIIVVWFSCGAASAVAAKKTIEKYSNEYDIIIANNPVDEEHIDNIRFKNDISSWLGYPIITCKNQKLMKTSEKQSGGKRQENGITLHNLIEKDKYNRTIQQLQTNQRRREKNLKEYHADRNTIFLCENDERGRQVVEKFNKSLKIQR